MKLQVYILREIEDGIHAFMKEERNFSVDTLLHLKPYPGKFFLMTGDNPPIQIRESIFSPLFKQLGFQEWDKIASIVYRSEEELKKFVLKRNPSLLTLVEELINFHTSLPEIIKEEKFRSISWVKISKRLLIIPEFHHFIVPLFLSLESLEENTLDLVTEFIIENQKHPGKIIGKINHDHLYYTSFNESSDKEEVILTLNNFESKAIYGAGNLNKKKKELYFCFSITTGRGMNEEEIIIHYDGYDYSYSFPEECEKKSREILIFTYMPLTFAGVKAEYYVEVSGKNDRWPSTPYLIFPWYIPVIKAERIKTIHANSYPEEANETIYFPGKKLSSGGKKINEPFYLAKPDLG